MIDDCFGQATGLKSTSAAHAWDQTQLAFLAHSAKTSEFLDSVLENAPQFALAHITKGLFCLLLGRRELYSTAGDALKIATDIIKDDGATSRERRYLKALDAWLNSRPSQSIQHLEDVLRVHPEDPLAMKLSHAIRFVLGDKAGMRRSIERIIEAYEPSHKARGYLLGCYAFALEETGEYARAEIVGRQAIWLAPNDAWGLHAVAHVYDMTGNSKNGINWLSQQEHGWSHCNNFKYHVWWHKALMHLDLHQIEEVLALYDNQIRAEHTDDYRDIANATSLLFRLELEGIDVGKRWKELAEIAERRIEDGCLTFADLHYLLALIRDNRRHKSACLLDRMVKDSKNKHCDVAVRMSDPGLAAANGLRAFGSSDFLIAFAELSSARAKMQLIGGSHAQRDVFERLTIDAGLRAGELKAAQRILDERTALRNGQDDSYSLNRRRLISEIQAPCSAVNIPA